MAEQAMAAVVADPGQKRDTEKGRRKTKATKEKRDKATKGRKKMSKVTKEKRGNVTKGHKKKSKSTKEKEKRQGHERTQEKEHGNDK